MKPRDYQNPQVNPTALGANYSIASKTCRAGLLSGKMPLKPQPLVPNNWLMTAQDGFPTDSIADEYLAGCQAGWQTTLAQLKKFVEA